jgi:hypothetical protein
MKTKVILAGAVAGAAILFAADQPKKEPTEFDKLKAKVAMLEGRIAVLENRIDLLAHTPKVLFDPATPAAPQETWVPPNIGEREVNGLKIYAVPLKAIVGEKQP